MKHILLSLCGITPQIITETLYTLLHVKKIPLEEIWLITTHQGKECILKDLLADGHGIFYRFCRDYHIPVEKIQFDSSSIIVTQDIADIQNFHDNEVFANLILELVREKTQNTDTVLHCSLAGGRKTMSVYFALAMQFYGRMQDKLYHILVSPPEFENNPNFYYPPPIPEKILTRTGNQIFTDQAKLELAEIPYIRLRNRVLFDNPLLSFAEMVEITQKELAQIPILPGLTIDLVHRLLRISNYTIQLTPIEMAVYLYYAEKSLARNDDIPVTEYERYFEQAEGNFFQNDSLNRLLDIYRQLVPYGMIEKFTATLKKGYLDFERIIQFSSRIKGRIIRALGDEIPAEYYIISPVGRYRKCYGIKLDKSKIKILYSHST